MLDSIYNGWMERVELVSLRVKNVLKGIPPHSRIHRWPRSLLWWSLWTLLICGTEILPPLPHSLPKETGKFFRSSCKLLSDTVIAGLGNYHQPLAGCLKLVSYLFIFFYQFGSQPITIRRTRFIKKKKKSCYLLNTCKNESAAISGGKSGRLITTNIWKKLRV